MSNPQGGIIRTVRRSGEYFTTPKDPFNDDNLSFGARGILAYIFSKPNDWVLRNDDLYRQSPAGRTAIDRMLKELKDNYYLYREKRQDEAGGALIWVTTVYEFPEDHPEYPTSQDDKKTESNDYPKVQNPTVGKPDSRKTRSSGIPIVGKPDDILTNELTNKDSIPKGIGPSPPNQPKKLKKKETAPKPAAVHVYRSVANRFPSKAVWSVIDQAIGDKKEDLDRFGEVVKWWIGQGYNPLNVNGIIDVYQNGEKKDKPKKKPKNKPVNVYIEKPNAPEFHCYQSFGIFNSW